MCKERDNIKKGFLKKDPELVRFENSHLPQTANNAKMKKWLPVKNKL